MAERRKRHAEELEEIDVCKTKLFKSSDISSCYTTSLTQALISNVHLYYSNVIEISTSFKDLTTGDSHCTTITFYDETKFKLFKDIVIERIGLKFEKAGYFVSSFGDFSDTGEELPAKATFITHTYHIY